MSFSVEFYPPKEEIFKKSDDECKEQADMLRNAGEIFVDPEFPPNSKSLGKLIDPKTAKTDVANMNTAWLRPHQLAAFNSYRLFNSGVWHVWNDPWPFHVWQGNVGDCWLLGAIMVIARKKELLEQIVPKRPYTMHCGIVQIRLCIDGKWKVIKTDFHLPQIDGLERGAALLNKQCWVAFIEKAVAKMRGSYGGLHGGTLKCALQYLTGAYIRKIYLNMLMDKDRLWELLIENYSAGFLICTSTRVLDEKKDEKERKLYVENGLEPRHGYAILDFKEFDGARLLQIGNPGDFRWTGKWSCMPSFVDDHTIPQVDRFYACRKIAWMCLEDFLRYFDNLDICEYRDGWHETRMKQTIKRRSGRDTQILRLKVEQRCEIAIDVNKSDTYLSNIFLNIHQSNSDDDSCGELISSSHEYSDCITSAAIHLNPGTYLVLAAFVEYATNLELLWVVRSPTLENVTIDFVTCPYSTVIQSVQQTIIKCGVAEHQESDNVTVYTWTGGKSVFVMVDNREKCNFIRVGGLVISVNEIKKHAAFDYSVAVPPMSRKIVGYISCEKGGQFYLDTSVQYKRGWKFWKWWDWLSYTLLGNEIDAHTLFENGGITA